MESSSNDSQSGASRAKYYDPGGAPIRVADGLAASQEAGLILSVLATVIDAPPILASPDALVFAPHCDLALMVVQQERAPARVVAKAVARLVAGHGKSAIGFMLSRAKPASFHDAYIENYSVNYLERSHAARRGLVARTEH